jgi:hypothetical protein
MRRGEKNMSKQGGDNQIIIEDLPVDQAQQDEVKGGVGGASGGIWKTSNFLTTDPRG